MDWRSRVAKIDTSWAFRPAGRAARHFILSYVLGPLINHYTKFEVRGGEVFDGLKPPAILASNHQSHLDTPTLMQALPKEWRTHTATVAAADYFYRNRIVASLVSLSFATIPVERKGGLSKTTRDRLQRLMDSKWNLLIYPEGTRSRDGTLGRLHLGAAYMSLQHNVPLLPIYIHGTRDAMPVGRNWPRRHQVIIYFGTPIYPSPGERPVALTLRLQGALEEMRMSAGVSSK